jgi:hypothetical protein
MAALAALQARVEALEELSEERSVELRALVGDRWGGDVARAAARCGGDAGAQLAAWRVVEELHDVPAALLVRFFHAASKRLEDAALMAATEAMLAKMPFDSSTQQSRTPLVKAKLNEVYASIWASYHVAAGAGQSALDTAGFLLNSEELGEEEADELDEAINAFQDAERDFVGQCVLGPEEFGKRKEQQRRFMAVREEIMTKLEAIGDDQDAFEAYLQLVEDEGQQVQHKIRSLGSREAQEKYTENPDPEDELKLMRFQALQMMMQDDHGHDHGDHHGHSHDGKACGGHGHAEPAPAPKQHGHSHDGKPCGGHGHAEPAPAPKQHGHSHDGKPCGGHGHAEPAPAPSPKQQHGHSHAGKPCHGHGH